MRYAVLIIGLVLTVGLFFQSLTVNVLSNVADSESGTSSSSVGLLMSLMWLIACGLVIPKPNISAIIFALSAVVAAAGWSDFPDLKAWSGVAIFLAILSYLGHRGKKKADAKEHERDEMMRQMLAYQAQLAGVGTTATVQEAAFRESPAPVALPTEIACPSCGESNTPASRFCANCGMALTGTTQ